MVVMKFSTCYGRIALLYPILAVLFGTNPILSQSETGDLKREVLQVMDSLLLASPALSYKAMMLFKGMGEDTYEERHFSVALKWNENNPLHAYDFEVRETLPNGEWYSIISLDTLVYVVYTGTKGMGVSNAPAYINKGSYIETLWEYFILPAVYAPFLYPTSDGLKVEDVGSVYYLHRSISDRASREIWIDKTTRLPQKYIDVNRSRELDLSQEMEVAFYFDTLCHTLPDDMLSPGYYTSLGYTQRFDFEEIDIQIETVSGLSDVAQKLLLSYAFVNGENDTIRLTGMTSRYIVLDFWYASCLPCLRAMPALRDMAEKFSREDVVVAGINCFNADIRHSLTSKFRDKNIDFPLLFGSRDLVQHLGINSFPTYLLITPEREIEFLFGGVAEVEQALMRLLGKE